MTGGHLAPSRLTGSVDHLALIGRGGGRSRSGGRGREARTRRRRRRRQRRQRSAGLRRGRGGERLGRRGPGGQAAIH